jgi:hypothetical protein
MNRFAALLSKHKREVATLALVLGFFVDLVTFRNLNLDIVQIILAAHLTVVAGSILVLSFSFDRGRNDLFIARLNDWTQVANQYSTGNLLSAFLVLYSVSGSLSASWPFFALIIIAVLGNEIIRLEKYRLPFQTTLFFLNLILFAVLAVPIAAGSIGTHTFFIGACAALIVFAAYVWIGHTIAHRVFAESAKLIRIGGMAVFAAVFLFYFVNLIPPIPLSMKDVGFYHSIIKTGDAYSAIDEIRPWYERFLDFDGVTLHLMPGEPAYVYVAIFAPARLDTDIVHHWQRYDLRLGEWVTTNTVRFPIMGGRHGGYRSYSLALSPAPDRYRVSVETARGAIIGRAYLVVEHAQSPMVTSTFILE